MVTVVPKIIYAYMLYVL